MNRRRGGDSDRSANALPDVGPGRPSLPREGGRPPPSRFVVGETMFPPRAPFFLFATRRRLELRAVKPALRRGWEPRGEFAGLIRSEPAAEAWFCQAVARAARPALANGRGAHGGN